MDFKVASYPLPPPRKRYMVDEEEESVGAVTSRG
jgi:hypothetical protein